MNKPPKNKYIRIIYFISSISILIYSLFKISTGKITAYPEDYIFLTILILSFILVNKYSINLKVIKINFIDFIISICYLTNDIYITILFIFVSNFITFLIEYKNNRNLNLLTENVYTLNSSLIILSAFASHLAMSFLDKIYYIKMYPVVTIILFSIILLFVNYILYCIDLSFMNNSLVFITLENGLYYIFLNFLICTVISSFAIYLYKLYGYSPIVVMTAFLIFISFSLNSIDKFKTNNKHLKSLSQCTTFLVSKNDYKIKLQQVIQLIENMLPFTYCGVYIIREKYTSIYPISYKSSTLITLEELKFASTSDNNIYTQLINGISVYNESKYFKNSLGIVNVLSKEIKYTAAVPIKDCDNIVYGFILICLDRYLELSDELELLSTLCSHIGMMNFHINANSKNNLVTYKSYDGLIRYIDYNIKYKIFFTLAIVEIENYNEIIAKYNTDFYETFKSEVSKYLSKFLSPKDNILCFEKEDIYIVFNLLDSKNAQNKLDELAQYLKYFKYKDIAFDLNITYSVSEHPIEGISADEIIDSAYRKLNNIKSA